MNTTERYQYLMEKLYRQPYLDSADFLTFATGGGVDYNPESSDGNPMFSLLVIRAVTNVIFRTNGKDGQLLIFEMDPEYPNSDFARSTLNRGITRGSIQLLEGDLS